MPLQPFEIRQDIDLQAVNLPMRYEQPLHKGNKNAHLWRVTVKSGVEDADLSGAEAMLWLTHFADGRDLSAIGKATIEGNAVQALFPAAAYAQAGEAIAVMEITSGEMTLGAAVLTLRVMDTKSDVVIDEDDLIPDIGTLLAEIAAMRAATKEVNAALEMIGPAAEAAEQAKEDAEQAVEDAQRAILATGNWGNVTVTVSMLLPNELPVVTLSDTETGKTMAFALPRGLTGLTPNLRIGTVTTLDEGEKARAEITGTAEAPVLNLWIPRGYTGRIDNMPYYTGMPRPLGEASPGTSDQVPRGDHVHPLPEHVPDADKLGGKSPEYYTPYTNLADNSDFTHWIAQMDINTNHGGTYVYGGDRWILTDGTISGDELTDESRCYANIQLNGTLVQVVPSPPAVATAFVEMVSGEAEISYEAGAGEIILTSAGGVIKNVLLLEGVWTEKPQYVSKGYAAELSECRRYFQKAFRSRCPVSTYKDSSQTLIMFDIPLAQTFMAGRTAILKTAPSYVRYGGTSYAVSNVSISSISGPPDCNIIAVTLSVTSSFTTNQVGYIDTVEILINSDLPRR